MKIILAVDDVDMVSAILDNVGSYLRTGDIIDLVSGNGTSNVSLDTLTQWHMDLEQKYGKVVGFYAHTAGLANIEQICRGSSIGTILYDYEPGFTGYQGCSQELADQAFSDAASVCALYKKHLYAYPSGRGITNNGLGSGCGVWDYGTFLSLTDGLIVQTQTKLTQGIDVWKSAITTVSESVSMAGFSSLSWIPQVTVGGGVNTVTASLAVEAVKYIDSIGFNTIYVWWSANDIGNLTSFLSGIRS